MSNVVRKKLSQCQKQIVRSLGLSDLEPFKAADTINRFCENLNLPTNIHDAVCKVSLRALDMGFVNGICVRSVFLRWPCFLVRWVAWQGCYMLILARTSLYRLQASARCRLRRRRLFLCAGARIRRLCGCPTCH